MSSATMKQAARWVTRAQQVASLDVFDSEQKVAVSQQVLEEEARESMQVAQRGSADEADGAGRGLGEGRWC